MEGFLKTQAIDWTGSTSVYRLAESTNLPRGRIGYVRFKIITEGCDEPCLSLKALCVRVNVRRFDEDSSDCLERIKIRIQMRFMIGSFSKSLRDCLDRINIRI